MKTENSAAATWVEIDTIHPWGDNPRNNEKAAIEVARSIERFGFSAPIIARTSDRVVIAGHTRLKAAKRLGLDKVPCRFMDLDPAQARALALADNRLGEIADWDTESLVAILGTLENEGVDLDGLGWSSKELDRLMNPDDGAPDDLDLIAESYEVLVKCDNEGEQRRAIELIEQGGFECTALIS